MKVGVTTKQLCEEHGIQTWEYSLECPELEENDPNGFCGTFTVDVRGYVDEDNGEVDVSFNWAWADYDKTAFKLEIMKKWVEDNRDEIENLLGKKYTIIETKLTITY
jgi:hypothetical protein